MKKIIALAIASAFVAPAVLADVTITGKLTVGVEYAKFSGGSLADGDLSRTRLVNEGSELFFKGTDKLDGGIDLYWQTGSSIKVGSGAGGTWGEKTTIIGLKGSFGDVQIGKQDDALDPFQGDVAYAFGDNMDSSGDGVYKMVNRGHGTPRSIIRYQSPNFSGVNFRVSYDFGAKSDASNYNAAGYAGALWYKNDMFAVGAGYKHVTDNASEAVDGVNAAGVANLGDGNYFKAIKLGASVTPITGLDFSAQWNRTKSHTALVDSRQDGWGLGVKYATGKNTFNLAYGKLQDKSNLDNTGAWGLQAGYNYSLSKQTTLLAAVHYVKNDTGAQIVTGANTLSDPNDISTTVGTGFKQTVIAVGLKTEF